MQGMPAKRGGGTLKGKDSGGFKVQLSDSKIDGPSRFAASYDPFYGMTGVVGYGPSRAKAIEGLEKAASRYHEQRRREEAREYDEEKEQRIRDDDY
jgi:hypothetical protein